METPDRAESGRKFSTVLRCFARIWPGLRMLLQWAYISAAIYTTVGIWIYPPWWKRLLLEGGFFKSGYLGYGFYYLYYLIVHGDPLGLFIPLVLLSLIILSIYYYGKFGWSGLKTVVRPPSKRLLLVVSVVLVGEILTLHFFVKTTFQTQEEFSQGWKLKLDELADRLKVTQGPDPDGPLPGFFLYLDANRVSKEYNTLQNDLTLASETKKTNEELKGGVTAKAGILSAEGSKAVAKESTAVFTAVPATAEREANTLIHERGPNIESIQYVLGVASFGPGQLSAARSFLKDVGIDLTEEQEKQARTNIMNKLIAQFAKKRSLVRFNGPLHFGKMRNDEYEVSFNTFGSPPIKCVASLDSQSMESEIKKFLNSSTNGWDVQSASILGIAWDYDVQPNQIQVKMIPLCIW